MFIGFGLVFLLNFMSITGQHMNGAKRPCLADSNIIVANSKSFSKSPSSVSHNPCMSDFSGRSPLSLNVVVSRSSSPLRVNSSLPSHLLSSFKSFGISPVNSIDIIRSLESIASIGQMSDNTTGNLGTTTSGQISFDCDASQASDSETHLYDQCRLRHENVNMVSKGKSSVHKNDSTNIKPSCLRMPSPKIGFFDAVSHKSLYTSVHFLFGNYFI